MSPFYIKHLINMRVSIFLFPPNKGFARLDPGLWEMANSNVFKYDFYFTHPFTWSILIQPSLFHN